MQNRITIALQILLLVLVLTGVVVGTSNAAVPIRISVKFVLDENDMRDPVGEVNEDAEVETQVERANTILRDLGSEFRVELLEIVDVSGIDEYHDIGIVSSIENLRNDARDERMRFRYRDDAINVYITHVNGSAATYRPSWNDVMMMGQSLFDTTLAHELGHDLDLAHTFDADSCADTLMDRDPGDQTGGTWDEFDVAEENFGTRVWSELNSSQQTQVENAMRNLLSYHDGDNRSYLSPCQLNRNSASAWDDRDWIVSRVPIYVDAATSAGGNSGSWGNPMATVDEALSVSPLGGRSLVLLRGNHVFTGTLGASDFDVVARGGTAAIHEDISIWRSDVDPLTSGDPAVVEAMRAVQVADRDGEPAAALAALMEGERVAEGEERIAIRLELGGRLRRAGRFDESRDRYEAIARETKDETLRRHVGHRVSKIRAEQAENEQGDGQDAGDASGAVRPSTPNGGSSGREPAYGPGQYAGTGGNLVSGEARFGAAGIKDAALADDGDARIPGAASGAGRRSAGQTPGPSREAGDTAVAAGPSRRDPIRSMIVLLGPLALATGGLLFRSRTRRDD